MIKLPLFNGGWGAFWLMYSAPVSVADGSKISCEVDIIESAMVSNTIANNRNFFNSAFHFDGYGSTHKEVSMEYRDNANVSTRFANYRGAPRITTTNAASGGVGINIYDGKWHKIACEWSPEDIAFFVDDMYFASNSDMNSHVRAGSWEDVVGELNGIPQNPNYIKLSVEAAEWALNGNNNTIANPHGDVWESMLVDYVIVMNGPKNRTGISYSATFKDGVRAFAYSPSNTYSESGRAITAVYDSDGFLVDYDVKPFEIKTEGMWSYESSIDITKYPASDYVYKVFFWDNDFSPLTAEIVSR
jgi:hypothetical protein